MSFSPLDPINSANAADIASQVTQAATPSVDAVANSVPSTIQSSLLNAAKPSETSFKHELMTLEEVYQIEFGTRAMWKVVFENAPAKYKKAMLGQSVSETSRMVQNKKIPAGNWFSFVPQVQHQGELGCTLYDDRLGTIEKWARKWWASTNHNQTYHNLEYPTKFVSVVYVYHYNHQFDLIFSRKYVVLPKGAINTQFDTNVSVSTVKLNFDVVVYQDL